MTQQTTTTPPVWGDEALAARAVLDWASNRAVRPGDPKTTARTTSELMQDAGQTITAGGLGALGLCKQAKASFESAMKIEGINRYVVEGLPLKTYDCSQITDVVR